MQAASTLELLAQLATTILGFSGVVAVLGSRASGDWIELDRRRFHQMVNAAVLALLLSLLPLVMHSAGFDESTIWAWSSGIGGALCVLVFARVLRGWVSVWSNSAVSKPTFAYVGLAAVGAPALLGLNAVGVLLDRTLTPYLLSCLLVLGMSVVLFLRLLEDEIVERRAV